MSTVTRQVTSRGAWIAAGGLGLLMVILPGCTEPIFAPNQPRSQYDRYDRLRNQHAPQYIEDDLGRRTPNIRARLTPKP